MTTISVTAITMLMENKSIVKINNKTKIMIITTTILMIMSWKEKEKNSISN